jgi:hypothetical protein
MAHHEKKSDATGKKALQFLTRVVYLKHGESYTSTGGARAPKEERDDGG